MCEHRGAAKIEPLTESLTLVILTIATGPHVMSSAINLESGQGAQVALCARDNGSVELDSARPVYIILVDETHSTSIVHHNDVSSNGEIPIPIFFPSTYTLNQLLIITINTHPKRAPGPRSSASYPRA